MAARRELTYAWTNAIEQILRIGDIRRQKFISFNGNASNETDYMDLPANWIRSRGIM